MPFIVFATLILALILFVWGKLRHDIVALLALFVLVVTGQIDAGMAFDGFAHPAVITVASVLVIGKALEYSGLVDWAGSLVARVGERLTIQILTLSFIVAVASAFMNNVGALAIMMPIAIHLAKKSGHSPSYVLMPLSFASLLGGMTTLMGTPPNIIISSYRAEVLGDAYNMFDFTPVGVILATGGIIYVSILGWRLLPKRIDPGSSEKLIDIDDYITEVEMGENSPLVGRRLLQLSESTDSDVQVLGIVRGGRRIHAPSPNETFTAGDILILETDADGLKQFLQDTHANLADKESLSSILDKDLNRISVSEAVVTEQSILNGRTVSEVNLRRSYGLNLLAISRTGREIHQRLGKIGIKAGDVLMLQGNAETLDNALSRLRCLPLAKRELRIGYKSKIPLAVGIFTLFIMISVLGYLPVHVSFTMGAVSMVVFGVMPLRDVYTSIDWPIIVLLGAMLPVGGALESSGGAEMIANHLVSFSENLPPYLILALMIAMTMLLSDVINNAATVVLMAPIAVGVATSLEMNLDPFIMAVAIGASSSFLTPIGHQSNTLVMGPGGYAFSDYWRMGLVMDVIILTLGVPSILYFWPI